MNPLVSVVTPSWNQGQYLPDCIRSVSGLAEGLVEHIVVDNCSDDSTPEVLARHSHLRTVVEPDRGQSDALNKGFALAEGKWILWLNADDFLFPGMLENYIEVARTCEGLDAIYGHMVFVDEGGKPMRTLYHPQWAYYMSYFGRYCFPSTGTLYRAATLKENPLDVNYHIIMDTEWMLRNGKGLSVKRLRKKAVSFRVTDTNKTSENIRTGRLTPRHAEERKTLSKEYPFYGNPGENSLGFMGNLFLRIVRTGVRARMLADKGISRQLDKSC